MTETFDELEVLPWSEVSELHEDLFQKQLDYVLSQSDFYQQKYSGVTRTSITSLKELPNLPLTTKDELRESLLARPPLGLHAAASLADIVQIQSSSGTTGNKNL